MSHIFFEVALGKTAAFHAMNNDWQAAKMTISGAVKKYGIIETNFDLTAFEAFYKGYRDAAENMKPEPGNHDVNHYFRGYLQADDDLSTYPTAFVSQLSANVTLIHGDQLIDIYNHFGLEVALETKSLGHTETIQVSNEGVEDFLKAVQVVSSSDRPILSRINLSRQSERPYRASFKVSVAYGRDLIEHIKKHSWYKIPEKFSDDLKSYTFSTYQKALDFHKGLTSVDFDDTVVAVFEDINTLSELDEHIDPEPALNYIWTGKDQDISRSLQEQISSKDYFCVASSGGQPYCSFTSLREALEADNDNYEYIDIFSGAGGPVLISLKSIKLVLKDIPENERDPELVHLAQTGAKRWTNQY